MLGVSNVNGTRHMWNMHSEVRNNLKFKEFNLLIKHASRIVNGQN